MTIFILIRLASTSSFHISIFSCFCFNLISKTILKFSFCQMKWGQTFWDTMWKTSVNCIKHITMYVHKHLTASGLLSIRFYLSASLSFPLSLFLSPSLCTRLASQINCILWSCLSGYFEHNWFAISSFEIHMNLIYPFFKRGGRSVGKFLEFLDFQVTHNS